MPGLAVTSLSLVIRLATFSLMSVAKRTSRLVRMPTSLPLPFSTTGMPEISCRFMRSSASASVASGWMVSGFTTMPLSKRFTLRTSSAWRAMSRFLWMTPMPPCWAMQIAMRASVTVSMAEDISGMLRPMRLVSLERVSAWAGSTEEAPGSRSTSSNVKASRICMPTL